MLRNRFHCTIPAALADTIFRARNATGQPYAKSVVTITIPSISRIAKVLYILIRIPGGDWSSLLEYNTVNANCYWLLPPRNVASLGRKRPTFSSRLRGTALPWRDEVSLRHSNCRTWAKTNRLPLERAANEGCGESENASNQCDDVAISAAFFFPVRRGAFPKFDLNELTPNPLYFVRPCGVQ